MSPIVSDGTYKENDMADKFIKVEDSDVMTVAANLAGYLVHVLKEHDIPVSYHKTEDDLAKWFELGLGDNTEFQDIFLLAAVWILKQRKDSERHYFMDNKGRIDYHTEYKPTEADWDEEMILHNANLARKNAMEAGSFGSSNNSSSNEEGSE